MIRDANVITVRVGRTEMIGRSRRRGRQDRPGRDQGQRLAADGRPVGRLRQAIEAGDWVLAIGSPFGLERTVSAGIVSATSRNNLGGRVGTDSYEDFIQIDVAINPGNSGGPLIDLSREASSGSTPRSRSITPERGGNQGIGFAISSAMARRVVDQLVRKGKVVRGYLGVVPQSISPDRAKQLNVPDGKGALVGLVLPASPAARAGLKADDVIVSIDGKPVTDAPSLRIRTFTLEPGTQVPVSFYREGKEQAVNASIVEMPPDRTVAFFGFSVKDGPPAPRGAWWSTRSSPGARRRRRASRPASGSSGSAAGRCSPRRSSTTRSASSSPPRASPWAYSATASSNS